MIWWRSLIDKCRAWFWKVPQESAPPPRTKKTRKDVDHSSAHYYLDDLLESLDDCFNDMRLLRRADVDAGDVFERVGVTVGSSKHLIATDIEPVFHTEKMPSIGCAHLSRDEENTDDDDAYYCSFAYFIKAFRPVNVQASNSDVYKVGMVWKIKNKPFVGVFHVSVLKDGTVKLLRECAPKYQKPGFVRMEWSLPSLVLEIAAQHRRKYGENDTPDQTAQKLFSLLTNAVVAKEMGVMVRVRKGTNVATFAIDMLRTPYFFADREKTVNHNGQTKRILHIVRTHMRSSGKLVKSHWRGLRRFAWNGYDVSIDLPGFHHGTLMDFNAPTYDPLDAGDAKMIELAVAAEKIDNMMTAP